MRIIYSDYDLQKQPNFVEILEFLGGREVDDQEVWEIAREYEEIPIFENILYNKTLSDIEFRAKEKYDIDIDYYINSRDTHLYIKNNDGDFEEVWDLDTFKEVIKENEKNYDK